MPQMPEEETGPQAAAQDMQEITEEPNWQQSGTLAAQAEEVSAVPGVVVDQARRVQMLVETTAEQAVQVPSLTQ